MAPVHDMELRVTVRIDDLTIIESVAEMHTFPHAECPAIVLAFAGLVGLSVARGYTREVQRRFGGPRGCTHLEQLARSLGPLVVQAVTSRRARAVSGVSPRTCWPPGPARGPGTPAISGPRAGWPTRSWPPAGGRAGVRTRPLPSDHPPWAHRSEPGVGPSRPVGAARWPAVVLAVTVASCAVAPIRGWR